METKKMGEELLSLKPETEIFIRGLVDSFYKKKGFQIDTNSEMWQNFVSDLLNTVQNNSLKKKIIYTRDEEEKDYLIRYYLINERPKLRVTIHNALISDEEGLHNHPWPWASLILSGGYFEETPEGKFWTPPGNFRVKEAKDLHRLIVDTSKGPVWTLFIMGEKEQDWGFQQEDGTVKQWQKHLLEKTGKWYEDQ